MSEYSGYPIKQLWQMVDAAKQGLQPSHDQVAALNKAQQMLSGHAESLERARDQLAAKWPPETNAASAAYLTELDRLIIAVKDTALSCAVNVFHVNTVSDAIIQAHATLEPLHKEYVKNEGALAKYDAEINAFGAGASLIPGGSTVAKGAAKLFTSPPVEDGRQDQLTAQAQQAMVPLSGAAQDGAAYIKPPTPYEPPTVGSNYDEPSVNLPGGSGHGSPGAAIPPPNIDAPAYTQHQRDITTNRGGNVSAQPSTDANGLILSDYKSSPTQPLPNPALPSGSGPGGESPTGTNGLIGAPPGASAGIRGISTGIGTRSSSPFGIFGPPRGGVIGSLPGGADGSRATPSRVNPSGGVIGQQPGPGGRGGVRTGGQAGRITGGNDVGAMGSQPRHRGRCRHGHDEQRWDPDNPWEINEGVDPIIMPDALPGRVDPGPGIIGIDR